MLGVTKSKSFIFITLKGKLTLFYNEKNCFDHGRGRDCGVRDVHRRGRFVLYGCDGVNGDPGKALSRNGSYLEIHLL